MKAVFAPWRMQFIMGKKEKGCVFCKRVRQRKDRENLILYRGRKAFIILNKYPYNNGHLMVVPYRHVPNLSDIREEEFSEISDLLKRSDRILQKGLKAQGINVGLNQGRAAGAGIADHIHFHVIPRWEGDANFWPLIGETKSMPEHLLTTYDKLKKVWK